MKKNLFAEKLLVVPLAVIAMVVSVIMLGGCGKVDEKVTEIRHDVLIKGNWLLTDTINASRIEKAAEKESVVLVFRGDRAAFSPVNSVKGKAVYMAIAECTRGPRDYKTDKSLLIFPKTPACEEKQVNIEQVDETTLKFSDPNDAKITRVFRKISDDLYQNLVAPGDRRL